MTITLAFLAPTLVRAAVEGARQALASVLSYAVQGALAVVAVCTTEFAVGSYMPWTRPVSYVLQASIPLWPCCARRMAA
jgi:hypothetical protein